MLRIESGPGYRWYFEDNALNRFLEELTALTASDYFEVAQGWAVPDVPRSLLDSPGDEFIRQMKALEDQVLIATDPDALKAEETAGRTVRDAARRTGRTLPRSRVITDSVRREEGRLAQHLYEEAGEMDIDAWMVAWWSACRAARALVLRNRIDVDAFDLAYDPFSRVISLAQITGLKENRPGAL
jgi:hypothetical protein